MKNKHKNKNKKVKAVGVKGVTYFEMDARVDREVVEPVLHRLIYGSDSDSDSDEDEDEEDVREDAENVMTRVCRTRKGRRTEVI